jgi:hypothetical protein
MKRLVLLAAALMACGVAVAPAGAGPRSPSVAPVQAPATTVTTTASAVTLGWLRNNLVGFDVGPSRATGFGKARLTGFTLGCPECRWYRVINRMTNHQPKDPTAASATTRAAKRGGFCWPWQNFPWSGNGCWNNMASWNWGQILENFNYHPVWDPMSTIDRIVACFHGAYSGLTGGVIGKQSVGILLEMADLVRVTPTGIAYSIVGGCTFDLYHH